MNAALARSTRGDRACRRITREHARTFYLASACLPRATRAHAYAVYGFCRWVDDGVDSAADRDEAAARLARAHAVLDLAYSRRHVHPAVSAFGRAVRDRSIPRPLFDDLLAGMAMDLDLPRYQTYADLDLYCYRVAGVVGLMMAHLFGHRDPGCLPRAVALGTAMQLTNILRDVGEDRARGRIYLPLDELAEFDLDEADILAGRVDDRFRAFMRSQIERARRHYAESELGIPDLSGDSSRLTARAMGRLYAGILDSIEANGYDVFRARARVPGRRKLAILTRCRVDTWLESSARFWR